MTASTGRRRLIWFCQTEAVAAQPDSLRKLRREIGLTTIMPESPVCHTSGFAASRELAHAGPFEDWRCRTNAWPRAREGIFPPVAGIVSGHDDTALRQVLEVCAREGIEVWGHLGLYSYGGDVYPELAMCDLDGQPLDRRYQRWGIGLCPSRAAVNDWVSACLAEATGRYGVAGFCVDHARYPAPANLHSLLGCGCSHCAAEAEALGYSFASLRTGLHRWLADLRAAAAGPLQALVAGQAGFWDFRRWLGEDEVVLEWLECRARLLAARMEEFHATVHQAGGTVFGSDVFPPSIALLGGHDYGAWSRGADFLTGGSSYGGVVGWATCVPNLVAEWAPALAGRVSGMDVDEALQLLYLLFGYQDLELPRTMAGLKQATWPLEAIYAREVRRLRAAAPDGLPLYPPVTAQGDATRVRRLCEAVAGSGCDGAMLTLDPDNAAALDIIRETLAA